MTIQHRLWGKGLGAVRIGAFLVFGPLSGPQSAAAATAIYTNQADFVAAISSLPVSLNEFTNSDYYGWLAHPIRVAANGISYWIASQPPVRLVGFDGAVSTHDTNDGILVTFTSTNVMGVGGYFYAADTNAMPISGTVTLRLDDGTATNVTSSSGAAPPFVGFLSDGPVFSSLSVTNGSAIGYPALGHFYVVGAIPTPSIAQTETGLLISWDAAAGFVLQTCPDMQGDIWTNVTLSSQQINNQFQVVVPRSGSAGFFRVVKQ